MANSNAKFKLPIKAKNPFSSQKGKNGAPNKFIGFLRGIAVYVLITLAALVFFAGLSGGTKTGDQIPLSQAVQDVKDQKVQKLDLEGDKVSVNYKDGKVASTRKEPGESIYQVLKNSDVDPKTVNIEIKDMSWQQGWFALLGTLLPVLVMVILFFFIFRQAKDAGQGIFSFGQSRAKLYSKDAPQVKFTNFASVD